jgi:hypothetical protein
MGVLPFEGRKVPLRRGDGEADLYVERQLPQDEAEVSSEDLVPWETPIRRRVHRAREPIEADDAVANGGIRC